MSKNERRNFLRNSLLGIPALGLLSAKKPKNSLPVNSKRRNRICVSTYSLWRFNGPKEETPIEYCMDQAAARGFEGVELVLVQMAAAESSHLQEIKRQADQERYDCMGVATDPGRANPDIVA